VVLAFRAFYVIGPALAAWAVVLAAIGFTRPDFPGQLRAQRVVVAISALLMLAVILSATIGAKWEHPEHPEKAAPAQEKPAAP
jgi:predicted Na+-dependent transporter